MKPYLAVNTLFRQPILPLIKQEALLFDQITFVHYANQLPDISNELEWLSDKDILIDLPPRKEFVDEIADDLKRTNAHIAQSLTSLFGNNVDLTRLKREISEEEILATLPTRTKAERASFVKNTSLAASYLTRFFSTRLSKEGFEAYPIYTTEIPLLEESPKHQVIQIVLNGLPVPDERTSWEQILEFRSDPDSKSKFLDLRHWMSEMARAALTHAELEEKLEYLMSQYQRHTQLHKMKTNAGVLETTVVTTGEIVENLVKIKWGKLAKMFFSLKQRRLALLEGELTSPGSEIAYMIKTRETFTK